MPFKVGTFGGNGNLLSSCLPALQIWMKPGTLRCPPTAQWGSSVCSRDLHLAARASVEL